MFSSRSCDGKSNETLKTEQTTLLRILTEPPLSLTVTSHNSLISFWASHPPSDQPPLTHDGPRGDGRHLSPDCLGGLAPLKRPHNGISSSAGEIEKIIPALAVWRLQTPLIRKINDSRSSDTSGTSHLVWCNRKDRFQ